MPTFDTAWLATRAPFDEAALDRPAIAHLRTWAAARPADRPLRVVDLGSGTGVALRRAARWLGGRAIEAFAVDAETEVLAAAPRAWQQERGLSAQLTAGAGRDAPRRYTVVLDGRRIAVTPLVGDLLEPLDALGGPRDGTVDLLLGHALADVLPLDRLAHRTAALLRPGGLAHVALTYDGETSFAPVHDPGLEARVLSAYHRHMDRRRAADPDYGGSTAGRRLAAALADAGLEIIRDAPSSWQIDPPTLASNSKPQRPDSQLRRRLLDRMLRFVVDSLFELGEPPADEVRRWEIDRRALLAADRLSLRVRHRDVLARRESTAGALLVQMHP